MARRNSMQQISFMDFSFFPVKGDTTELARIPDVPAMSNVVASADVPFSSTDYNWVSDFDDHSSGSDPSESSTGGSSANFTTLASTTNLDSSEHSHSVEGYSQFSSSGTLQTLSSQRFKPFHEEKWGMRYKELVVFFRENGHSAVPHTYPKNPQLARWVKRQRRQYKLLQEGKPSTMTTERLELLSQVGFIWDSHELNWREKLLALTEFKKDHGHCNIPSNFGDKKLSTWVKCQRRQFKLHRDGKPSAMTPERIAALQAINFEWEIRPANGKATKTVDSEPVPVTPTAIPSVMMADDLELPISSDQILLFQTLVDF